MSVVTEDMIREAMTHARGIAYAVGHRTGTLHYVDEYEGSAYEGLSRAANTYDAETHVPWVLWARLKMHGAVWDECRRWVGRTGRAKVRTDCTPPTVELYDHASSETWGTAVPDVADEVNARFDQITVDAAIAEAVADLTESQREAFLAWISGERGAMTDVANERGVSLSAVSISKATAVRKVAKHARKLTDMAVPV